MTAARCWRQFLGLARRQPRAPSRASYRRPRLEGLEERLTPAAHDTPAAAIPLVFDSRHEAEVTAALNAPDEADLFRLTVGSTGRLRTAVVPTSPVLDPRLCLYDDSGRLLIQSDDRSPEDVSAALDQHLRPGTYYLAVSAQRGFAGPGDAGFRLTSRFDTALPPFARLPAVESPTYVAAQDLNGDGRPDVVTASEGGEVSVLLGTGDGTFHPAGSFQVMGLLPSVTLRDVNRDSFPDLVTADELAGAVGVYLGNGDGSFQPGRRFAAGDRRLPRFVVVEDVNGDGRTDVVSVNEKDWAITIGLPAVGDDGGFSVPPGDTWLGPGILDLSNDVSVLLGNGDGSFQPALNFAVGSSPSFLAVHDVNGDGRPDLITADQTSGDFAVLPGNGDGTFRMARTFSGEPGLTSLAVQDVNGDGPADLVTVTNYSRFVSVLPGNGDGSFQPVRHVAVEVPPSSLVLQDINGDGRLDLVGANESSGEVSVLLGNGDGSFQPAPAIPVGRNPSSVAVQDVNGDGRPDVLTANTFSDDVSVLLGVGDGTFQSAPAYTVGKDPSSVAVQDVNGDGRPDVVTANKDTADVSVLLGNDDGSFRRARNFSVGSTPFSVDVRDVNGDGRPDLVTRNESLGSHQKNVSVLLGNGDGTFQAWRGVDIGDGQAILAIQDVNGDDRLDLVAAVGESLNVALGNGDGSFQPPRAFDLGSFTSEMVVQDVNNDGRPDIVTPNGTPGGIRVLLGRGDGTFQEPRVFARGHILFAIVVHDVNDDGRADLIAASFGSVSVLLGRGNGSFQPARDFAVEGGAGAILAQDVNGDGGVDLVTLSPSSNRGAVLLGNGAGDFQAAQDFAVGSSPSSVELQDVSGDGRPDLVIANKDTNDLSVLLGNGDGTFAPARTVAVGRDPSSLAVEDVNGDGRPDLITANAGAADISVLLNRGAGTFAVPAGQTSIAGRDVPRVEDVDGDGARDAISLNRSGQVLFRHGGGDPGQPFAPFVVVNPTQPARDFTVVGTSGVPIIAAIDRTGNAVTLYAWSKARQKFLATGSIPTGLEPVRIAAAPLLGGLDDLVITNDFGNSVTIAFQKRPGEFAPQTLTHPVGAGPADVSFADVNGDGLVDILVSGQVSGDVTVLFNDPDRSFTTQSRYRSGTGLFGADAGPNGTTVLSLQQTVGAVAADFREVGAVDVVALNRGTNSFTYLRKGSGGVIDPQPADVFPTGESPVQVLTSDFRHQGRHDLAVLTVNHDGTSEVLVYQSNGDGTFAPPTHNPAGFGATGFSFVPRSKPSEPDRLLVGNEYGDFLTLTGDGSGRFTIDRGDLDGKPLAVGTTSDGRSFVVVADQRQDRVQVFFRKPGTKEFDAPVAVAGETALLAPGAVQLVDLNRDNKPDLLVASRLGNDVLVYPGLGQGKFGPAASFAVGFEPAAVSVKDLNSDGTLDLAVVNQGSNDVSVLLGSVSAAGRWTATPGPRLSSGGSVPLTVSVGDFDGDSIADLRVTNRGGQLATIPGIGSSGRGTGFFRDNTASVQALSGNGTITQAVFDARTGQEFVVRGDGGISRFTGLGFAPVFNPAGAGVTRIALAGANLVAAFADGEIGLLEPQADGRFALTHLAGLGDQPTALEVLHGQLGLGGLEIYLTRQGSEIPLILTAADFTAVVTALPEAAAVAQATSLPGRDLVLVAILLNGGLVERLAGEPVDAASSEATFFLLAPPARGRAAAFLSGGDEAPAEADAEGPVEQAEAPRPEVFRLGVEEAVEQRLRAQRVAEIAQDTLAAIRRWIDLLPAELPSTQLAQDECPPLGGALDQAEEPNPARPAEAAGTPDAAQGQEPPSTSQHAPPTGAAPGDPPAEPGAELPLSIRLALLAAWLTHANSRRGRTAAGDPASSVEER